MNISLYDYFLFDYADVISLPQDRVRFEEMAMLLDMEVKDFHHKYWKHRRAYDLGQKGPEYWQAVAGKTLSSELVDSLIVTDCESWGAINDTTIEILKKLKANNIRTGLLSNLPMDLVQFMYKSREFLSLLDDVFFSAEINLVKPDGEIYEHVLQAIKVAPIRIIFFDDRDENLNQARMFGINTFLVTQKSLLELAEQINYPAS